MTISSTGLTCSYTYDAVGVLTLIAVDGRSSTRFWRGSKVVNALSTAATGESRLTWLRAGGQPVLEQVSGTGARVTLLAAAVSGSVLLEADSAVRTAAYAPHGARAEGDAPADAKAELAFNGELLDSNSGCYLLGAGHHRPYSPTLGVFLAPDSLSPFADGGLNAYAYCAGDPVNRTDPSGHFWKWIVAGIAVVAAVATLGVLAAAGAAALTASAVVGAALMTAGAGLEVAAAVVKHEKLSTILGIAGAVAGIAGGVAAGAAVAKGAANIKAKAVSFSQRIGTIRTQGLSGRGAPRAARQMAQEGASASASAGARPAAMYVDDAAQAAAQRRGYPMFNELSARGQRNATRNAGQFAQQNAIPESSLDFDNQSGLYSMLDRRVIARWDPARTARSASRMTGAADDIPANLPGYTRLTEGAPPSYREAMRHPVAQSTELRLPPPYSEIDPTPVRILSSATSRPKF